MLPNLSEIERRRKRLGLTQQSLAQCADVSRSSIAKIENAYSKIRGNMGLSYVPNYEDAKRILECLEIEEIKRSQKSNALNAEAIAHFPLCSVGPDASLRLAKNLMKKSGYSQLPVLEHGTCIGRIDDQIILSKIEETRDVEITYRILVGEVMGPPFPVVPASTPVEAFIPLLKLEKAVIVINTNIKKPWGIVTVFDLMK